jgi:hypothetical protein
MRDSIRRGTAGVSSPIQPRNPVQELSKYTFRIFRRLAANGRSPWMAAGTRLGAATGRSCTSSVADGSKLISTAVKTAGGTFESGRPTPLFDTGGSQDYDVSPDNKRFLFVVRDQQDRRANAITVMQNWQAALKKK